ncbi:MAG: deoxyuridine 5'-triphosphate nucleotidohydrolase [Dehalococcoidales bacterium]|nr:deoxyuridine 5'-triphosphate nucleotidohydrolase [Dehalococcoidales bacterium]
MSALSRQDILCLLDVTPPLVEEFINLDEQLQTNGFDLTLRDIASLESCGTIGLDNRQRKLADLRPLEFDNSGYIELAPGPYSITYNEIVHMPKDLMALATPRSSLLRCGVAIHTAVWDAGYSGRSQSLMMVYNPKGFRLQRNARVLQLVFLQLARETDGYRGVYQGENVKR